MKDIPDSVSKLWADEFEKYYTKGSRWEEGEFSPDGHVFFLAIDGVYTTSLYKLHWSRKLSQLFKATSYGGIVCGFSHAGYGLHYLPEKTIWRLDWAVAKFADYMGKLREDQTLIPICFSLGAAVAILGLINWRESTSISGAVPNKVPAVILIAPALTPSPALLRGYEQKVSAGELQEIPWPVLQLCPPGSPDRKKLLEAFRTLPSLGTQLHVIFWEQDRITPYRPGDWPQVRAYPILSGKPLGNLESAVDEHVAIKGYSETETALMSVIRKVAPQF